MWKKVSDRLRDYPERLAVARVLVENGLSIRDSEIWCNEILISAFRIAKAAKVDRRTVIYAIKMIEDDNELREIFKSIRPSGSSLKETARHLNFGVVEITPTDAMIPGILASLTTLIAEKNISIRQAIVDDPEFSPEPKLTLITEKKVPGDLIPKFLEIKGVAKVSIY
jgi:hypothetical protein